MSPANLDTSTGSVAFVFNAQNGDPWHRSGVSVDGAMTWDEVFERCPALDFQVTKVPVFGYVDGALPVFDGSLPDGTKGMYVGDPTWALVVRTDTLAPLGIVRNSYKLFQNRALGEFADAVRGESTAAYDTAGSLYGGRIVFAQLDLGDTFKVRGDDSPWVRRLLVHTGHDGRHALKAKRTQTRVVCSNTFSAAIGEVSPEYVVRHTSNMTVAVDEARMALQMAVRSDAAFEAAMDGLTRKKMSLKDMLAFTVELMPTKAEAERAPRTEAARDAVMSLFKASPTLEGVPLTHYRAFQAVGEYADHYRDYRKKGATPDDVRAEAILDGAAAAIKDRALVLLK